MSNAELQLLALAQAAIQHASEQHGQDIPQDFAGAVARVDIILDQQRMSGSADFVHSLTACYGAWLGELIRCQQGGNWTGLNEPAAPRIEFNGQLYSPMDAVQRRLLNGSAPTLCSLLEQLQTASRDAVDDGAAGNLTAWNAKAEDPRFVQSQPLPDSCEAALAAIDPWLLAEGPLDQQRLLCLAAGGGTHGPLHAIAGADVTVVDFSSRQLERDRVIASHLGLKLELVEASMMDLSALAECSFDTVIHPVSLCYVPQAAPVYQQIARVLRPGGLYISQQKQPGSQQASLAPGVDGYTVATTAGEGVLVQQAATDSVLRETGTQEFVHPLSALLGSLCSSGFVIEDILEPPRGDAWAPAGSPEHRGSYLPPYLKIKARRRC